MVTVRTFTNNVDAWLAHSLLASEGIEAVVADDNINSMYAAVALGARLQVAEKDEQRAREVLEKHEGFEPLADDFVPPQEDEEDTQGDAPRALKRSIVTRLWAPFAFCSLAVLALSGAFFLWLAPPQWLFAAPELVRMGNTALQKKDYDTALRYYSAALKSEPFNTGAHYDRGVVYYEKGDYAKAIADCSDVLKIEGGDWSTHWLRAQAYVKTGQSALALADFSDAISINPSRGEIYRGRGRVYERTEEWEKAVSDFDTALRLDPGDYMALNAGAYCQSRLGNYSEALADANEALRLKPDDNAVLVTRGLIYCYLEQYDEALADLDGVIQRNPSDSVAYVDRSFIYNRMEQYDKALADAAKGVEIDPKDGTAFLTRGWAYFKLGDGKKAVADITHAIDLEPGKWEGYDDLAWIYSTSPQADVRDGAKAVQLATKACELSHWNQCRAIGTLAAAEAETGRFDDAVKHATQALGMAQADKTMDKKTLEKMTSALAAFREGKPFRDTGN